MKGSNPLLDPSARLIVAHRGASGDYPENTVLAFAQGLAQGADALEFDVRPTADGVPVVMHDETVDRTTGGTGRVAHLPLAYVRELDAGCGERIPTLAEVLDGFPLIPLLVEIKDPAVSGAVLRCLDQHGASGRVLIGSFHHDALIPVRAAGVPTTASRREVATFWAASRIACPRWWGGYVAFSVPERHGRLTVADRRFVRLAGRMRWPVHVWTVDSVEQAWRLRALGVAGLVTNQPAVLASLSLLGS